MPKIFSKIMLRSDARAFLKEVLYNNRYSFVQVPLIIENNSFIKDHYAFFLVLDAFIKYDLLIEDESFIEEYIYQLRRIFKRMSSYQDVFRGVHTLIGKIVGKKLEISNLKLNESKEKILHYIYQKYIVEGYFYYGFSSTYKKEIDFGGISKDGFLLDSRLSEVNDILKKYEGNDVITRVESDITDSFIIASYFSFLGPDYLEKILNSGIFNEEEYDKDCFYFKDVERIKNNFEIYASKKGISMEEKTTVINSFLDVWKEDSVSNSYGCIAFIKRSHLKKNYLKDIEEIISNSKHEELSSSIAMIMESRYSSYELDQNISSLVFELVEFPSYSYIVGNTDEEYSSINLDIDHLKVVPDLDEKIISKKKIVSNYGFTSIFALLGLLFISLGVTITIILGSLGG